MTLKYHFQNIYQLFDASMEEIVSDISNIDYLRDSVTKMYKSNEYTIVVCNTLDGNKGIGTISLKYEQEYCK